MNSVVGLDISKRENRVQAFLDKGKPYYKSFKVERALEGLSLLCKLFYKAELEPYKKRGSQLLSLRNLARQHENITGVMIQTKLQFQAVLGRAFPEFDIYIEL